MSRFYTNIFHSGNKIFVREIENGIKKEYVDKYSPYVFIPTTKKSNYRTIFNDSVEKLDFENISECKEFIETYKEVDNFQIYGDIDYITKYIHDNYDQCEYNFSDVKICTFDLECEAEHGFPNVELANEKLIVITLYDSITDIYHVVGIGDYKNSESNVVYYDCHDERHLIEVFLQVLKEINPDILTGWNIDIFDIPYLINRIIRLYDTDYAKKISPWNIIFDRKIRMRGQERASYKIVGISTLDYMDLYKKFTYTNQESYALTNIAFVELGKQKLSYDEFINIKDFYKSDYKKFVDYNIKDVILVNELEEKLKLIELIVTMAYDAGVNYSDVYSQVKTWDSIIYSHLLRDNIIIPPKKAAIKAKYEGAYVKEPIVGMHDWVVSFDLNSLYPNLIVQYNISPEMLIVDDPSDFGDVDKLLQQVKLPVLENKTMAANGYYFKTEEQGFLPAIMQQFYDDRVKYKDLLMESKNLLLKDPTNRKIQNDIAKYDNIQMAKKIQLNSAYGALANEYFRFYDVKLAEAITLSGQLAIRWIENALNSYFNKLFKTEGENFVIAADTDSVYLRLGKLVESTFESDVDSKTIVKFLDKVCTEHLEPFIEEKYKDLKKYLNSFMQRMEMSREVIADKGIWTSKKRYILNVHDSEGYRPPEPYLKVMGIEAVRSSTPYACREKIKNSLTIILNENQNSLLKYLNEFREQFKTENIADISFPRTANNLKKYSDPNHIYTKGTPIHIRGVLLYNKLLKEKKLERKYPLVQEGEKIKFIYLKLPNIIKENIISFPNVLPVEFDLNNYIDYDLQFEKSYLDPLKLVVDAIGWELEERSSLEDFFL